MRVRILSLNRGGEIFKDNAQAHQHVCSWLDWGLSSTGSHLSYWDGVQSGRIESMRE
jgi:hypothetical protein